MSDTGDFTRTPNFQLYKPDVNADYDIWGDHLNYNTDVIDGLLQTAQTKAVVSDTPPPFPNNGDLWFDTVAAQLFVWYVDPNSAEWVIATAQNSAALVSDLPPSSPTPGQFWFDSVGCQLYVWVVDPTSAQWVVATSSPGAGITEAPTDGAVYGRQGSTNSWHAVLPASGGTITNGSVNGPLNFWGTSSTINTFDAQVFATGGATLSGNPGQGDLGYVAGTHLFKAWDGTTAFRVRGVAGSYEFWEADGGVPGTAATLRAVTDLNPDCDGAFAAQGHGSFVFGNGEGQMLSLTSINAPIINYLNIIPGGYNQGITLAAAGGEGLPVNIALRALGYGGVNAQNSNGVLAVFSDPATSSGVARTSYFNFYAGMSGVSPKITLGGAADDIWIQAPAGNNIVYGNGNGPIAIMSDPAPAGHPRQSYLQIIPGTDVSTPAIKISTAGIGSPPTTQALTITGLGAGGLVINNTNGPIATFPDPTTSGVPRTAWFTFTPGASGFTPTISLGGGTNDSVRLWAGGTGAVALGNLTRSTMAAVLDPGAATTSYITFTPGISSASPAIGLAAVGGTTIENMFFNVVGNGAYVWQNVNGRLLTVTDPNTIGTAVVASLRVTGPSGAGALTLGMTAGTGTNVPININSLGTGEIAFLTGGASVYKQARILNINSPSRTVDITGGGGGASVSVRPSAGNLYLGNAGPVATTTTSGLVQIPNCAGTPTGVPLEASLGATIVYDSTANKLWIYSGAAWRGVLVT